MLAGLYNVGVVIERSIENGTNVFVEQKCDGENNQSKLGWMSGKAETSKYGGKGGKCVGNKTKRVYISGKIRKMTVKHSLRMLSKLRLYPKTAEHYPSKTRWVYYAYCGTRHMI